MTHPLGPGPRAFCVAAPAVLVALLMAGCGPARGGEDAARPEPTEQPEIRGVDALPVFVYASAADMADGGRYMGEELTLRNRVTEACLREAGFDVTSQGPAGGLGWFDNGRFPDIARMKRTLQYVPGGPNGGGTAGAPGQSESNVPANQLEAYEAARDRCWAEDPISPLLEAWVPLHKRWMAVVERIQTSAEVSAERADYTRCMIEKGVPEKGSQTFYDFVVHVEGELMRAGTDEPRARVDREMAQIFVECAESTVTLQEELQTAAKEEFIQTHLQEIRELEKQTQEALDAARAMVE